MTVQILSGFFDTVESCEQARIKLVAVGVREGRIVLSRLVTEDSVAAEAPGQSYDNQTGEDSEWSQYAEDARSAACVLSVEVERGDKRLVMESLLASSGVRRVRPVPDRPPR